jgi:hypothetical protein
MVSHIFDIRESFSQGLVHGASRARRGRCFWTARAVAVATTLTTALAAAPEQAERPSWETAPATRRSGLTAGFLGGVAFGTVAGYPNDFSKIDVPGFRSATSGVGSSGTLYVGGALTDWFTFGLGLSRSSYGSERLVTASTAYLFHLEAFPLFSRGGRARDIGLFADFGTGTATVRRRTDAAELSSSGSLSIGGVGVFWETWRLGDHVALGPLAAWHYERSLAMTRYFGEVGIRMSVYGGP